MENENSNSLKLIRTAYQVKKSLDHEIEPLAREQHLTVPQVMLLSGLESGNINNINSACRWLNMAQGNTSTLCKSLEQGGFLKRQRWQEDERVVMLELTDKGRDALCAINARFQVRCEEICRINPEIYARLVDGMKAACELTAAPGHII